MAAFAFGNFAVCCDTGRKRDTLKAKLAAMIDTDGDGTLSVSEINEFWPKVDANNDGSISFGELYAYLHKTGVSVDALNQVKAVFKEIDTDGSGDISKEELFHALQTPPARCPIVAECAIAPNGKAGTPGCNGKVKFIQTSPEICQIEWDLEQCGQQGLHGFHVHEKADFSNCCLSAGPHYNPFGRTHGGPEDEERHVGDMGNIVVDSNGNSKGRLSDRLIKLYGETSIIGRSVMVHEDPDDLGKGDNSQPGVNGKSSKSTGNAGARIACGEIKLL